MSWKKLKKAVSGFAWEDYEKLGESKKDEYKFKFSNPHRPNSVGLAIIFLVFKSQIMVILFLVFLIATTPALEHMKEHLPTLIKSIFLLVKAGLVVISAYLLYDFVEVTRFEYKRSRWIKKNVR